MNELNEIGHSNSTSAKEYLSGRTAMPPGLRAALYLRVSTADQKPDLQYDGLRGYAERSGLVIVGDFCDLAVSGRHEGRPRLNALMAAARKREFDCVLVWKFARFARSTRHLLMALEEFRHLGVRFISVQDQIDTDSPAGRAMFTIIGAMAELESALISERVTASIKAAKARGKHLGRRDRGVRRINQPQHPANPRENRRQGQPWGCRRDNQTGSLTADLTLVTTFYTYIQPPPS